MRVLIACEFSGTVRDQFLALGHEAASCDLLPSESANGVHYQCDVRDILGAGWDLMIAHPPCTYLTVSGLHWNKRDQARSENTEEAIKFFRALLEAPIPRIAIENPVGCISTRIRKPDQIIQPYQFGEDASKKTCLWLKGLPALKINPSDRKDGRKIEWPRGSGKIVERWANQTDSGQNVLGPSEDRWKLRSLTYTGIAKAMASQWGSVNQAPADS